MSCKNDLSLDYFTNFEDFQACAGYLQTPRLPIKFTTLIAVSACSYLFVLNRSTQLKIRYIYYNFQTTCCHITANMGTEQ